MNINDELIIIYNPNSLLNSSLTLTKSARLRQTFISTCFSNKSHLCLILLQ